VPSTLSNCSSKLRKTSNSDSNFECLDCSQSHFKVALNKRAHREYIALFRRAQAKTEAYNIDDRKYKKQKQETDHDLILADRRHAAVIEVVPLPVVLVLAVRRVCRDQMLHMLTRR